MNTFIRTSNKLLLATTLVFGIGAFTSQFNRARAMYATTCSSVSGTIGTGAGCDEIRERQVSSYCSSGVVNDIKGCCRYVEKEYFCVKAGVETSLGTKAYRINFTAGEACQYINEAQDGCIKVSRIEEPEDPAAP